VTTQAWKDHAYPLQLIKIELQGTRHSSKAAILAQLKEVVERIERGDVQGESSDDDFGYIFALSAPAVSVFDAPASQR
jgi:Ran GTPase-activating protein (RanGAP) involved in mRNA processing and transport